MLIYQRVSWLQQKMQKFTILKIISILASIIFFFQNKLIYMSKWSGGFPKENNSRASLTIGWVAYTIAIISIMNHLDQLWAKYGPRLFGVNNPARHPVSNIH
jgi:hypothetical protein